MSRPSDLRPLSEDELEYFKNLERVIAEGERAKGAKAAVTEYFREVAKRFNFTFGIEDENYNMHLENEKNGKGQILVRFGGNEVIVTGGDVKAVHKALAKMRVDHNYVDSAKLSREGREAKPWEDPDKVRLDIKTAYEALEFALEKCRTPRGKPVREDSWVSAENTRGYSRIWNEFDMEGRG
jgi:hypothetical protein